MDRAEAIRRIKAWNLDSDDMEVLAVIIPELTESEDERVRKGLIEDFRNYYEMYDKSCGEPKWGSDNLAVKDILAWLEKQKENPKSADSIQSNCVSNAKYEDRWYKVTDSLPDNGRLVLANDCLGNTLLARYDGEGNWEVSVYDNDDYYCQNTITKWCEIPSERQKEPQHAIRVTKGFGDPDGPQFELVDLQKEQKPAEWSEEDENMLWNIISIVGESKSIQADEMLDWLKSLRPSWKPSEEQMEYLAKGIIILGEEGNSKTSAVLNELRNDLKKLM